MNALFYFEASGGKGWALYPAEVSYTTVNTEAKEQY